MELLTQIGQFCRHHYEKLLLTLALLGLAGAVLLLDQARLKEEGQIKAYLRDIKKKGGAPVKPVDMARLETALQRAQKPPALDFGSPHFLLNPVKWRVKPDGTKIKETKGTEGTVDQLQIVKITPLRFLIAFDKPAGTGDKVPGYWFIVTNEVALYKQAQRIPRYSPVKATNIQEFILQEVNGPADNPTELVLELKDATSQRVSISKDKPYTRIDAYEADLKYNIGTKTFTRQRVNATLRLSGEEYKIVAINSNEVVLSGPNDKKYTVRQTAPR